MRKTLLACLLATASASANADWNAGLSYLNLSDSEEGLDISLGGIVGHVSYDYVVSDQLTIMPELRLGVGITDDTVRVFYTDVKIDLDMFTALSVRAQYELTDQFYVFANPSYAYAKIGYTIEEYSESDSDGDWEFGIGGGMGYQVSESTSLELRYESYSGTDVLSLGVSVGF
ncbi:outer membrane beta-barrel protein [Aestuariibacter sp. GS-14]|uniref:outer membrane beta-barrel protein n=1 Tax=Aestuariibacter sp. GS-14 TaxID=2590670 RepID=UPI0015E87095|nr:outer membrane beta-barrel protein [Aestuariibacter sp. GS-14]